MAEFGSCHRNEPSGALHGLMRVRGFTQDDAHIFCTEDQVRDEVNACIRMVYDMYSTFGFEKIVVKLSTRPENVSVAMRPGIARKRIWRWRWKKITSRLNINWVKGRSTVRKLNLPCMTASIVHGSAVLYSWTSPAAAFKRLLCGRKQRASGTGHDSPCDSRFSGALHWHPDRRVRRLLPNLACASAGVVMNITDSQAEYVNELTRKLQNAGIRVKADLRNEKIGFKIREHTLRRVPYMLVCGDKEVEAGKVAVRTRRGKDLAAWT
jgi:threonyl-tRNA synthetase